MYGRRNSRADRLGTPARSLMEARTANTQSTDLHDETFRYVY